MLSTDNEMFMPVEGFDNLYRVSSLGYVTNGRRKLTPYTNKGGYLTVCLTGLDGKPKNIRLHRIVANAFIPNDYNKPEVNHIDGDKTNNTVTNLEWVTRLENQQHAIQNGLWEYSKPALGVQHGKTSKYHNVGWDKVRGMWKATVRYNGKAWYQQRFHSEDEAAMHVNWILDTLGLHDRPRNVIC